MERVKERDDEWMIRGREDVLSEAKKRVSTGCVESVEKRGALVLPARA